MTDVFTETARSQRSQTVMVVGALLGLAIWIPLETNYVSVTLLGAGSTQWIMALIFMSAGVTLAFVKQYFKLSSFGDIFIIITVLYCFLVTTIWTVGYVELGIPISVAATSMIFVVSVSLMKQFQNGSSKRNRL